MGIALPLVSPRVFVTGATGFVGTHLCRSLVQREWQVVAAIRGSGAQLPLPEIRAARLELFSEPTNWQAAMRTCSCVVHLAARVHQTGRDGGNKTEYDRVNVDGSLFVAEQALKVGVERFVYLSSIKVNGEGANEPYRSNDFPDPKDSYGRSKWAAEQSLRALCTNQPMRLAIIRPPLVYGPGVKANFRRLMSLAASRLPLPVAAIANRRSLIGIVNLVDFIETCMVHPAAPAQPWLISDGEDLSTPDLLARIARFMHKPLRTFAVSPRCLRAAGRAIALRGVAERLCDSLQVDSSAARLRLGWKPPSSVDEELARTVAAYMAEKSG
jgi:nucleoside-diphosphate-sugar epimerase